MNRNLWKVGSGLCVLALAYSGCKSESDEPLGTGGNNSGGTLTSSGGKVEIGLGSGGKSTSSGGTGGTLSSEGWLEVCELTDGPSIGDPKKSLVIDDLDDGQDGFSGNGLQGGWFSYSDGTATGNLEPLGDFLSPVPGGTTDAGAAMHFQGRGFTEWGCGFGFILASLGEGQECAFDATAYSGLTFWAKGRVEQDGTAVPNRPGVVRVKVYEKDVILPMYGGSCPEEAAALDQCYDGHGFNFEVSECWQRYSIRFDDLKTEGWGYPGGQLDLNELFSVEFSVDRGHTFELWLDDVQFFVGDKPSAEPLCDGMGGQGGMGGTSP